MSENNENKPVESQSKWYTNKQLKDFGFFLLILLVLLSVNSLMIIANRKTWNRGLSEQIKTVLERNGRQNVMVEKNPLTINSPLTTSCAAFSVQYEDCPQNEKAVIIKVSTLFGPVAAVYLCHENNIVEFIDLTSSDRITEKQNINISKNMQIDYWKKRIPVILQNDMKITEGESK